MGPGGWGWGLWGQTQLWRLLGASWVMPKPCLGWMEAGKHREFMHKGEIQLTLYVYVGAALRGIEVMQI